jgi:hypothetical protein
MSIKTASPTRGSQDNHQRANRMVKYLGIGLLVWPVFGVALGIFGWSISSPMIAAGLFLLLFAPERINDERVKQLKLRAIMCGYAGGFVAISLHNFVDSFATPEIGFNHLSAYDSFAFATAIALVLFYYWRWLDGRATSSR